MDILTKYVGLVVVLSFVAVVCGCGHMESVGIKPPITYDIKGNVKDNVYTNPRESFRLRIPNLIKPGARVKDEQFPNGIWHVSMTDDLCREYVTLETAFDMGDPSVDAWIDRRIIPDLKAPKYELVERRHLTTRLGAGTLLRWKEVEAAPCLEMTFKDGKRVVTKGDAEIGFYAVENGGGLYRFIYIKGLGMDEEFMGYKRGPVEMVITEFIDGFEILKRYK